MIANSFKYATKVWLTSVLLSPFVYLLLCGIFNPKELHMSAIGLDSFIYLSLIIGFLYSIPNWLVFFFLIYLINVQQIIVIHKKIYIGLIGVILTFILFKIAFSKDNFEFFYSVNIIFFVSYSLTIITGVIIYKLKPDLKKEDSN